MTYKRFFGYLGDVLAYSLSLVLFYVWTLAYINGSRVVITINEYGEKYPELVLWVILLPLLAYGAYQTFLSQTP